MRINFAQKHDPSKGVEWQYLVQRVAYRDPATGGVRTTAHYDELLRRATMPSTDQCGHSFACCVGAEAKA